MLCRSHGPRRPRRLPAQRRTIRTLLSAEQFNAAIVRESARSDRSAAGHLALVLFKLVNRSPRALSTLRLIRTINQCIRMTDDVGWFDGKHVGMLLTDTTTTGALALAQQVCDAIERRSGIRPQCVMYAHPAAQPAQVAPVEQKIRVAS